MNRARLTPFDILNEERITKPRSGSAKKAREEAAKEADRHYRLAINLKAREQEILKKWQRTHGES